jgi:hypothetical protein
LKINDLKKYFYSFIRLIGLGLRVNPRLVAIEAAPDKKNPPAPKCWRVQGLGEIETD